MSSVNIGLQDPILIKALLDSWKNKYELNNEEDLIFRKLFRSAEMAYYALSIPEKNQSSENDRGLLMSFWISAIEILLNPEDSNKEVNKFIVLDTLLNHGFNDELLSPYKKIKRYKKKEDINFIQHLYMIMYNYRSKFLHGDEIGDEFKSFVEEYPKLSFLNLGPNLYRLVLYLFLKDNNIIEINESENYMDSFREYNTLNRYEKFFLNVLNSKNVK